MPVSWPKRATWAMSRSTAGWIGSFSAATRAVIARDAVTYCVRSLEPMEKKAASRNRSGAMATAGTSTMMPSGGLRAGDAVVQQVCHAPRRAVRPPAPVPPGCVTIGIMTLRSPCAAARARARSCVRKTSGRASVRRTPRRPRKGLASPSGVRPRIGLSPPMSRVRMVTGLPARPFEEAAVGAILLVLVRQRRAVAEQELRAHQADAVAGRRDRCDRVRRRPRH